MAVRVDKLSVFCTIHRNAYSLSAGGCCWLYGIKAACCLTFRDLYSSDNVPLFHFNNTPLRWPMSFSIESVAITTQPVWFRHTEGLYRLCSGASRLIMPPFYTELSVSSAARLWHIRAQGGIRPVNRSTHIVSHVLNHFFSHNIWSNSAGRLSFTLWK